MNALEHARHHIPDRDWEWIKRLDLSKPPQWSHTDRLAELWREQTYLQEMGLLDDGEPTRYAHWRERRAMAQRMYPVLPQWWPR